MGHRTEYPRFLTALLVILDPFAVIPIFPGLTAGYSEAEKRKVVRIAILTVGAVLALSVVLRTAKPIGDLLGEIGMRMLNRIFGLILAAIAVEVVANGLKQLFAVLGNRPMRTLRV